MTQFHFTPKDCEEWRTLFKKLGVEVYTFSRYVYTVDMGESVACETCCRSDDLKNLDTTLPAYTPDDIIRGLGEAYLSHPTSTMFPEPELAIIYCRPKRVVRCEQVYLCCRRPGEVLDSEYSTKPRKDIFAALNELRKQICKQHVNNT